MSGQGYQGDPADHLPVLQSPARAASKALADAIRARLEEGQGARAWRAMHLGARQLLVTLELQPKGDGLAEACRPWASFTDDERARLGALARELRRNLEGAEALR